MAYVNQTTEILKHLKHSPLTPLEALARFGCMRLAARIKELRECGYVIITDTMKKNGKRFALYRLNDEK